MSRRKLVIPDSLELLLDTICNTFGAVIFISILLSLLVRDSGLRKGVASLPEEVAAIVAARNSEIAQARARQSVLEQQLAPGEFGNGGGWLGHSYKVSPVRLLARPRTSG